MCVLRCTALELRSSENKLDTSTVEVTLLYRYAKPGTVVSRQYATRDTLLQSGRIGIPRSYRYEIGFPRYSTTPN